MKQVLVADDHFGLCQAVKLLLEKRIPNCKVSISLSLEEALGHLYENAPDVLVIDNDLPGLEKVSKIPFLRTHYPHGLIVLTSTKPEIALTANGQDNILFFDKSSPPEYLLHLLPET